MKWYDEDINLPECRSLQDTMNFYCVCVDIIKTLGKFKYVVIVTFTFQFSLVLNSQTGCKTVGFEIVV